MLSGCGSSGQSNNSTDVTPKSTPTEQVVNLEAKRIIKLKAEAYIDYNCTPKYGRWKDPDPIPGIPSGFKEMYVYNNDILGIDQIGPDQEDKYFLINDSADSTYGNFATRTVYLSSLYHSSLAYLYSYIYDIYSSEMKAVRKDYTRFKTIADKAALKICGVAKQNLENETLEATDLDKVQGVYDQLEANWISFNSWFESINNLKDNISDNIDASIKEMNTPTCTEYPTADGKYIVVKCTVP
jgi:hypothetical protein